MAYARGKYAKAISDRSGMEFPYNEMVKEWNGSFVHKSEYEGKHPQIRRKHIKADAIALSNARPRTKDNTKNFLLYTNIDKGILGTKLTSFAALTEIGNVTVSIS
tara:strand:- start:143 stop:457 length:315 start_codon:yes stop_codon:yes gene_type:complete